MSKGEMTYYALTTIVREMLRKGIITEDEYADIDTKLAEKYSKSLLSICG